MAEYIRFPSKLLADNNNTFDTCWLLCNFYTAPQHRGSGIARMLYSAALSYIAAIASDSTGTADFQANAYVRGFVWSYLHELIESYYRYGFQIIGDCRLPDVFQSIGEPVLATRKDARVSEQICVVETVLNLEPNHR